MTPMYIVLAGAAFLTAMISGIIGMGGGILFLASLFCFLPHGEAIPTHAAVQLVSNTTRVVGFISHVCWRTVGRFCIGAVPGAAMGFMLLWGLGEVDHAEPYLKILVGCYILAVTMLPTAKGATSKGTWWDFPLLGVAAGTAALTVGAVGPLIAPLFTRRGFVKERLIATKAVCQSIIHTLKIPAFLWLRVVDVDRLGLLTLIMAAMVIPGTMLGKRVLTHVSDTQFVRIYCAALWIAGLKVLCIDGLWQAFGK